MHFLNLYEPVGSDLGEQSLQPIDNTSKMYLAQMLYLQKKVQY